MSAPALIALANDAYDDVTTISAITKVVACMRPDLAIEHAMNEEQFVAVTKKLAELGHQEIVVVPLDISLGFAPKSRAEKFIANAKTDLGEVEFFTTDPLGTQAGLLKVLDKRLREAISIARVREIDALVLAGIGTTDSLANESVLRVTRTWGKQHRLPAIAAFAQAVPPAASEAVRAHRENRRSHVVVGSLFLTDGTLHRHVKELAFEAGALAVSDPIGAAPEIAELILQRYAVGAVGLVSFDALFA